MKTGENTTFGTARLIDAGLVASLVEDALPSLACDLRCDYRAALSSAQRLCQGDAAGAQGVGLARMALGQLDENAEIARRLRVPLCQDTGYVWVLLEIGGDVAVSADVFSQVDAAVSRAFSSCGLRKSIVEDALLDRSNTGDNTPAFCELEAVDSATPLARLHVMLKGGGSDNASRVVMLPPGAGLRGIEDELLAAVRDKGASACPPLVIGLGVGGTFDKVARLAKKALLREIGSINADARLAAMESKLLAKVNALGIGPGGFGGAPTAFAVHVSTACSHIAALPMAVNIGCCAMRSISLNLLSEDASDKAVGQGRQQAAPLTRGVQAELSNGSSSGAPEPPANERQAPPLAQRLDLPANERQAPPLAQRLDLPANCQALQGLRAGDVVACHGTLYTMRDAGHIRALESLDSTGELPYGLAGQALFYAGPTEAAAGRAFGAIGPTTASRMDAAIGPLMDAGITVTLGKGRRSQQAVDACKRNGGVYLAATGGAAALLAGHVKSSELVAWEDLGTEALRRLAVDGLPAVVAIDAHGNTLWDDGPGQGPLIRQSEPEQKPKADGRGVLITFEGGEGVGKSTQIRILQARLTACGYDVVCLREPGGTAAGEKIRELLLDNESAGLDGMPELLLYEAARAMIVKERIMPELSKGKVVLCDRFIDSTLAYQGAARGLGMETVRAANAMATDGVIPDRTILLVRDIADAFEKVGARESGADRLEAEGIGFHRRVNAAFMDIAAGEPGRIRVVACQKDKAETARMVMEALGDLLPEAATLDFEVSAELLEQIKGGR
jgi:dTMP kinase